MIIAANLIPAPRRRARAVRRRVRIWSAVCTAVALALMGSYASLSSIESGDRARILRALSDVERDAEVLGAQVAKAKTRNGDLLRTLMTTKAMVDHPDWSILLHTISGARTGQVMLEQVELRTVEPPKESKDAKPPKDAKAGKAGPPPLPSETYAVRIVGLSSTQAHVMKYVAALERTGLFDSVRPPETHSRAVLGRDLVGFVIECAISARPSEPARPQPAEEAN